MLISAIFDSLSRPALWLLLTRLSILDKIVRLFRALYDYSISPVRTGGIQSPWFEIELEVRQGCSGLIWIGCWKGQSEQMRPISLVWSGLITDLDFANDVSLIADLLELLDPALEMMAGECTLTLNSTFWVLR